ncbi:hypothetical protein KJ951_03790 [Patescibacteria group bacterium]|nr:hypothetical protein [Patescibacteria group bacterium]MBU1703499.1 hypothetical protein [Patescibacteria group bacterium]MBU1954191.1 hypothetical protein [Patescibacteria group bacterium]
MTKVIFMEDLGVKLHPVKKLQLWRAIKKEIFTKMDNNIITPERADEILANIKEKIVEVNTPEQVRQFYLALPRVYPELSPVTRKFESQKAEILDKLFTLLLDEIIKKGEIELAGELCEEMQNSKNHNKLTRELQKRYPVEFKICLRRFSHSQPPERP